MRISDWSSDVCSSDLARRRRAEDVQAVADLQLLQLAEVIVELAERRLRIVGLGDAAVLVEAAGRRELEDLRAQHLQAARIEAGGVVILVDQALELGERAVDLSAGQRRRQVIDDDRLGTTLGLGAFAAIVTDRKSGVS